ncbi:hypothetical protein V6N13_103605 [Hibiscus sabdariffa]
MYVDWALEDEAATSAAAFNFSIMGRGLDLRGTTGGRRGNNRRSNMNASEGGKKGPPYARGFDVNHRKTTEVARDH